MNPAISGDQSTPSRGASATRKQPIALTIAGFDPSSGAGVTADLKVFAAFGIYGMSCITGLTVQSTLGVRRVQSVAAEWIAETLETLSQDVEFAGESRSVCSPRLRHWATCLRSCEVRRYLENEWSWTRCCNRAPGGR